jgi:hypothetical protein
LPALVCPGQRHFKQVDFVGLKEYF